MRSAGRDELDGRRRVVISRVWPSVERGRTPVKRSLADEDAGHTSDDDRLGRRHQRRLEYFS